MMTTWIQQPPSINPRNLVKRTLFLFSQLLMLPLVLASKLEEWLSAGKSESLFGFCTHLVAMLPGMPGAFLRKGFYTLTLEYCSPDCHIGFGSIFSHRYTVVEQHVYIGMYTIIGAAHIGEYSLIGSRASIVSRKSLHSMGEDGRWTPYSADSIEKTNIGKNVWVGEGCTVAANIGEGSQVGSGSVVTTDIKAGILVSGNPPRFIKKVEVESSVEAEGN